MKPEDYVGLWQYRGVKASILDTSIIHGNTWVDLDRVYGGVAGYYGIVGQKHFAVGGHSSPAIYTHLHPSETNGDVEFSLLNNPLSDHPATSAILDFLEGDIVVQGSDDELYNLEYRSYSRVNAGGLLRKIAEEMIRGSDDGDRWVKDRMIAALLDTAADLAEGSFQETIEGVEKIDAMAQRLSALVKGK
jgi:hypothetical protein